MGEVAVERSETTLLVREGGREGGRGGEGREGGEEGRGGEGGREGRGGRKGGG